MLVGRASLWTDWRSRPGSVATSRPYPGSRSPRRRQRLRDVPGDTEPANDSPASIAYQGEKLFGSKTQHVASTAPLSRPSSSRWPRRCRPTRRPVGSSSTARSWSTTTARPATRRSSRSCRAAVHRSSSTTPPPDRLSTVPWRPRTRSGTTPSGPGRSRVHGGLRQMEHGRTGQQRLTSNCLRATRGGQGRSRGRPVPVDRQEVRRPHLGPRRAVDVLVPPFGPRGQGLRLDPDAPVHDQPPRQGHQLGPAGPQCAIRPGEDLPPSCGLLMKLDDTKWVQAYPKKLGPSTAHRSTRSRTRGPSSAPR